VIGSGRSESSGDGVRVEVPCVGREEDDDGLETDTEAEAASKEVFDGAFVRELFAPGATELEEEVSTPVREEALVIRSRLPGPMELGTVRRSVVERLLSIDAFLTVLSFGIETEDEGFIEGNVLERRGSLPDGSTLPAPTPETRGDRRDLSDAFLITLPGVVVGFAGPRSDSPSTIRCL